MLGNFLSSVISNSNSNLNEVKNFDGLMIHSFDLLYDRPFNETLLIVFDD